MFANSRDTVEGGHHSPAKPPRKLRQWEFAAICTELVEAVIVSVYAKSKELRRDVVGA